MKPLLFDRGTYPKVALLIKQSAFAYDLLNDHYAKFINETVLACSLAYTPNNKAPMEYMREYLNDLLKDLKEDAITTLFVADANYFKALTKKATTEQYYGDVVKCAIAGYESFDVILAPNFQGLFHNPKLQQKLDLSIKTLNDFLNNTFSKIGTNVIHSSAFPCSSAEKIKFLQSIFDKPVLTCDIETYGLELSKAKLGSIGFAWDSHNGGAFLVDDEFMPVLREFFTEYKGKLIFHNASFDVRNIIYRCFMSNHLDYAGLVDGLDAMYRNTEDTKLIAYLATNSTAGNDLKLKSLAFEFAGNYAVDDIQDITKIPTNDLLTYNLMDCLSTWYVFNKYYPLMVKDNQESVYRNLFLPALRNVTNMELVGFPMDMDTVQSVQDSIQSIKEDNLRILKQSNLVKDYEWELTRQEFTKRNNKLKKKIVSLDDCQQTFNPASNQQLAGLLFEHMGFDVVDTTDSGAPATGKKVINKLYTALLNKYDISEDEL